MTTRRISAGPAPRRDPWRHRGPGDGARLYHLVDRKTFPDAEAFARSLGGHLVSVTSQAEHDMLWNAFSNFDPWFPPQNDMWIGLTDSESYGASEGNYVWTSGEPVDYTNWGRGEPNNAGGNEDFVRFYGSAGGRWNDWGPISSGRSSSCRARRISSKRPRAGTSPPRTRTGTKRRTAARTRSRPHLRPARRRD